MVYKLFLNYLFGKKPTPPCTVQCWSYGVFGEAEGCEQSEWGIYIEPIKPGQPCLHPEKRSFPTASFTASSMGLCAAIEGTPIQGGPDDNTTLVRHLVKEK